MSMQDLDIAEPAGARTVFDIVSESWTQGSKYGPKQRLDAVTAYFWYRSAAKVESETGISAETIDRWRGLQWWSLAIAALAKEKNDELDGRFSQVVAATLDVIQDRLKDGDFVMDSRGEVRRKPIGAKDAASILSTVFDKRLSVRGETGGEAVKKSATDLLNEIANTLARASTPRIQQEGGSGEIVINGEAVIVREESSK